MEQSIWHAWKQHCANTALAQAGVAALTSTQEVASGNIPFSWDTSRRFGQLHLSYPSVDTPIPPADACFRLEGTTNGVPEHASSSGSSDTAIEQATVPKSPGAAGAVIIAVEGQPRKDQGALGHSPCKVVPQSVCDAHRIDEGDPASAGLSVPVGSAVHLHDIVTSNTGGSVEAASCVVTTA